MRSIKDIFRSYAEFDSEGRHTNGCDKESNHSYGDAYEGMFQEYIGNDKWVSVRKDIQLMMEIGVADGSSLLAWQEIFPNAHIVGMDIHPAARWNGEMHIANQYYREDCARVAGNRLFDVIVEDATHRLDHTLLTLYWMWPYVKPGGLYIVEEWSGVDKERIESLWPFAEIVDTVGPSGGIEPLIVFRKSR